MTEESSQDKLLQVDITQGVATLTLNRPEIHNALNETLIADLHQACVRLGQDRNVRVIVLQGAGRSFSAGADLAWMKRMAGYSYQENRADAQRLADMLHAFDTVPQPTIVRLHGAAIAGGTGLVACADIAIAAEGVLFGLSEVRLGLVPATIGPYVMRAIGARNARCYWLTGERFGAAEALRIGLVHKVVPPEQLDEAVAQTVRSLQAGAPGALSRTKELIDHLADGIGKPEGRALRLSTANLIAHVRSDREGREGIASFLEKRKPDWAN